MTTLREALSTGLRLRCPACRQGSLFQGLLAMRPACPVCGRVTEREAGYFVGAIYVNYALTVGVCLGGFFLLEWLASPPLRVQFLVWLPVCAVLPVLFFRHARSLWLSLDHYMSGKLSPSAGEDLR